ncbi:Cro/CI family transcriptional regulator [uncultured Gilvimarinus sp.]|uniref:Cro/CI family transcriptional regulator n=1 Tax=uncultured Gilvimarinus sp. TaxID=1689143 RepID=UPI0030D7AB74
MTKTEVLAHYKTGKAVAEALGLSESAVSQWPEVIPRLRAFELERITQGALKVGGVSADRAAA